jgi:hypothetical protein
MGDLNIMDDLTIAGSGEGTTIIDASAVSQRVINVVSHTVTISNLTVTGGAAYNEGGGILNTGTLTLDHVTVTENTANGLNDFGGGIADGGTLTVMNSTISNNTTGSHNSHGGGIMKFGGGTLTITNSTISGNRTVPSGTNFGQGGGVFGVATITNSTISGNTGFLGGGVYAGGSTNINNSTISGNSAQASGGGIFVPSGTTTVRNATIAGNTANSDNSGTGYGAGVYVVSPAVFSFEDTIIAGNTEVLTHNPFPIANPGDCAGTLANAGYNIVVAWTTTCTFSGQYSNVSPGLGQLQDNGGPTYTQAIAAGGSAQDHGNPGGCPDNVGATLTTDQRGAPRVGVCDIGAYEYGGGAPATPTPSPTALATPTASATATASPTVTVSPTPTPSGSGSPSNTPTASASPTPPAGHTQGDVNCDGSVDELDYSFELTYAAGLNNGDTPGACPNLNSVSVTIVAQFPWGDVNCDNHVNARDVLYLIAHTVGIQLPVPTGCVQIGESLTI